MKIISFINQKGGVGKTTSCINLAVGLSQIGNKVLVIDMDPQGNATTASGFNKSELANNIYHSLIDGTDSSSIILKTDFLYDIIPSNRELAGAEIELSTISAREYALKNLITNNQLSEKYDYILIDCPPSLSLLTINCLCASTHLVIPMQCEYFALEGLSDLIATYKRVKENLNPELTILGLLLTMFDSRNILAVQVNQTLTTHFGDKLFKTPIPRNVRLAESPSHRKPVYYYDSKSKGSIAYNELAKELHDKAKAM